MAARSVLILAALLNLAFLNVESRTIAGPKFFSNASTIYMKSKIGTTIKSASLKDAKKEGEEVGKEELPDPISAVAVESANKTLNPTHNEKVDEFIEESDFDDGSKKEGSSDVSEDKKIRILQQYVSIHGKRSKCADVFYGCNGVLRDDDDSEELDYEANEVDNGYYDPKRKSAFNEDNKEVKDGEGHDIYDDIDFDNIEDDDEDDKEDVEEDQENMEDLEGTIVKDNISSDNADDNNENKSGNENDEAENASVDKEKNF
ncbi:hypothetical protein ECG_09082 [Echinococcus granulosus]|nr:hypothetical protein EGR_10167 [Echinococcus granulosus]EUB54983.1 hypothetical protein EGR_10167 [Echinococcus granulosus]KAH9278327.1 hypothetical protein ECG_09082 [Echinococcus granulosus]CDS21324.1 expressed conserved protein [Echinococcus granulosus]